MTGLTILRYERVLDKKWLFRGNGVGEHIAKKGKLPRKAVVQTRMVKRATLSSKIHEGLVYDFHGLILIASILQLMSSMLLIMLSVSPFSRPLSSPVWHFQIQSRNKKV